MELEAAEGDTIKLSVATRFLKSWIQSHYAERLLACLQAEFASVSRIEITVRSGVLRTAAIAAAALLLFGRPKAMFRIATRLLMLWPLLRPLLPKLDRWWRSE